MDSRKFLSYSIGFIFIVFGALKLLGDTSVEGLVAETVFFLPVEVSLPLLGIWEIAIGVCFIYTSLKRVGLFLFLPHIAGTFLPILVVPEQVFTGSGLTLEGHYILKNVVLVAGAFEVQEDGFLDEIKGWFGR